MKKPPHRVAFFFVLALHAVGTERGVLQVLPLWGLGGVGLVAVLVAFRHL